MKRKPLWALIKEICSVIPKILRWRPFWVQMIGLGIIVISMPLTILHGLPLILTLIGVFGGVSVIMLGVFDMELGGLPDEESEKEEPTEFERIMKKLEAIEQRVCRLEGHKEARK